jgi:hypothetical protein
MWILKEPKRLAGDFEVLYLSILVTALKHLISLPYIPPYPS